MQLTRNLYHNGRVVRVTVIFNQLRKFSRSELEVLVKSGEYSGLLNRMAVAIIRREIEARSRGYPRDHVPDLTVGSSG